MRAQKQENENNRGEIMLEALIVYMVTMLLLFLIVSIFSVLFQAWGIQVIANETATKVAQTYRLSDANITTGYATSEQIWDVSTYRYWWGNLELEQKVSDRVKNYAKVRLLNTSFAKQKTEPEIEVKVKKDALARKHIEVTITSQYEVPFGEILCYFGFESMLTYTVTGYAECLDLIDYINTVDFAGQQVKLGIFDSQLISMLNSILGFLKNRGIL